LRISKARHIDHVNVPQLPYDILHIIIRGIVFDTLKEFSQVDKRTHSAAVPILFRATGFSEQWSEINTPWKGVQEVADTLLGNKEALLAAIMFGNPSLNKLYTSEQGISLVVEGETPFIDTRKWLTPVL